MSENNQYGDKPTSGTVTVASSGQVSSAFSLQGTTFAAFQTPAAITGTTYTFQGSIDNGATYKVIKNNAGSAYTFSSVTADSSYPVEMRYFAPYDKIKIDTGGSEASERTIKVKAFPL